MSRRIVRLVYFLIPLVFLFFLFWQKDFELNEDLGRHIVLGKIIVSCHCLPTTNIFSYTFPNFPWFTNSWLAAVAFYSAFHVFGKEALLYVKGIILFLSFSILYIYAWRNYSKFWSVIFSIPFLALLYFRFGLRPEIFSFLFFSLFLFLIENYRVTNRFVYLVLLVPLEMLWVNFHIYFVFGVAIYVCFIAEEMFKKNLNRKLLLLLLCLILATFINPLTYKMALLPLTIFNNYAGNVLENQSIITYFLNFSTIMTPFTGVFYLFVCLAIVVSIMYLRFIKGFMKYRSNIPLYYMLVSLLGIVAAGKMIRLVPLFAFLTFFPLVTNFQRLDRILSQEEDLTIFIAFRIFGIIVSLVIFVMLFQSTSQFLGLGFEENYQKAVDFVQRAKLPGPMLNSFNDGAYITFRLYPQQKVFIDARAEGYPLDFIQKYNDMLINPTVFDSLDKKYAFGFIMFDNQPGFTSAFINYILSKKEWVPVYVDHGGNIVFVRNLPENSGIIQKYAVRKAIHVVE